MKKLLLLPVAIALGAAAPLPQPSPADQTTAALQQELLFQIGHGIELQRELLQAKEQIAAQQKRIDEMDAAAKKCAAAPK